jgi:parallel beta helix pectate lyase-like protein
MPRFAIRAIRNILAAVVLLFPVSAAHARTLHVETNGVDGPACGPHAACRTINRAIANAQARDTILVGPGIYGDNNRNFILDPGKDEVPPLGCDCLIWVNKDVTLVSTDGAAATVIEARTAPVLRAVFITAGADFGRSDKGFTVTYSARFGNRGIEIEADGATIRGNQVIGSNASDSQYGILAVGNGTVLIEANQVIGWLSNGVFVTGSGKTVQKNQASLNSTGFRGEGLNVFKNNIATANLVGFELLDGVDLEGNAVTGNAFGIEVNNGFFGHIEKNNIVGNKQCGFENSPGVSFLVATNNYWGAATGPGVDPADSICNAPGNTTLATPFATRPFTVNAPINP